MSKILVRANIENQLHQVRQGKKIVFTNGCFDLLHVGHVRYLQQARKMGDFLFVGLNADASVKRLKGEHRPIQNQSDRSEILAALECVNFVCVFEEDTPEKIIVQVRPHILVKGGDWDVQKILGGDFVRSYGGEVKSLPFVQGKSTSSIVDKILKL